ncbi:hypothetical protein EVAR_71752_1 [Eumeta japonica]|uniref:Uncharacterized protein n=1 Tax=Eumeta variegata TaxID=151549 RepID=A0A4C1SE23_EUMVA|nr:hypothetical protein EVAR_71752_1 [Eumeta japonica]
MPLIDPEITQGAEQLEKAISSARQRSEDESDRCGDLELDFDLNQNQRIEVIMDALRFGYNPAQHGQ